MTKCVQFAKWPRRGRVKTRLAQSLGSHLATHAHIALCRHMLAVTSTLDVPSELHLDQLCWDAEDAFSLEFSQLCQTLRDSNRIKRQHDGDLGEKMAAVLETASPAAPIVLVGSDAPAIHSAYIQDAFAQLAEHDVVIGPAEDGGFVLIGARCFSRQLFASIAWGTSSVYAQFLTNAAETGLSLGVLPTLWDVDELADWQRWMCVDDANKVG